MLRQCDFAGGGGVLIGFFADENDMTGYSRSLLHMVDALGVYDASLNRLRMEKDDITPDIVGTWCDYDEVYARYESAYVNAADGDDWRKLLAPAHLRALAGKAGSFSHFTMRFRLGRGMLRWNEVFLECVREGEVMVASRQLDEGMRDTVVLQAVDPAYDFVGQIDAETGGYVICTGTEGRQAMPPLNSDDYDATLREYNRQYVAAEEWEDVTRRMELAYVKERLAESDEYVLYATTIEYGAVHFNRMRFCYQDASRRTILLVRIDITEIVKAQQLRRETDVKRTAYLDELPVACCVMQILRDDEGAPFDARYIYVNRSHSDFTKASQGKGVVQVHRAHFPDEEPSWFSKYCDTAFNGASYTLDRYSVLLGRHLRITTFQPEPGYVGSVVVDITDRVEMERELEESRRRAELEARQDSLTGLLNVRAGRRDIERRLEERDPASYAIMIVLDLDDFKRVNDTYGHVKGDRMLVAFARALREAFRREDVVYRLGGDEFVVFADDVADPEAALQAMMARLFSLVDALRGSEPIGTVSAGAFASREALSFAEYYERADQVLYGCKRRGKNNYRLLVDGEPR